MAKVREMTFKDAAAAFVAADKALQGAKTPDEKRAAALAYAVSERNARSAKARESDSAVNDLLK